MTFEYLTPISKWSLCFQHDHYSAVTHIIFFSAQYKNFFFQWSATRFYGTDSFISIWVHIFSKKVSIWTGTLKFFPMFFFVFRSKLLVDSLMLGDPQPKHGGWGCAEHLNSVLCVQGFWWRYIAKDDILPIDSFFSFAFSFFIKSFVL
jgi:hypothetical protein